MKKLNLLLILITVLLTAPFEAISCTSVIITGKATKDGRPLMWKNTDTQNMNHRLIYSAFRGYPLIGVVRSDAIDETKASIWVGTNSHGFSIMNTMSYNISEEISGSNNGALMRRALEVCRSVEEFRHFLDTLARPMKVSANYGVIDATGGAAFFETHSNGYYMLDVNNPSVAPNGYLVYTNFSYNGIYEKGQGYIRYQTASDIFARGAPAKEFSVQWILNNLSRSFYHSLMGVDFKNADVLKLFTTGYVPDSDFIPRKSTANTCVIQGVKPGEDPSLTTFWAVLGYPPTSVAIPAWVKMGDDIPYLLRKRDGSYNSRMCDMALVLKERVFSVERGNGEKYLNIKTLYNSNGTGYMQILAPIEENIFEKSAKEMEIWRRDGVDEKKMRTLGKDICDYIDKNFIK
ncbi:MAG: carcinine hydrolase/isopenicillin-N N-acyltransferase family protein [Bacteroidales bacterium]|jgi:hypothetical protein|nr:carcinine hydrolase/isopenicillin-N N-acyltransferase family protein [Bacteroidales bacterium]